MGDKSLNVLAFDMGASNGRAILGKYDGNQIELEVLHKFPNGPERLNGELYWDILRLFHEIKTGLHKAENQTDSNLVSLAIDTWGVDYGLLDKNDNLLSNPYHYRDSRTDGMVEEVFGKVPKEKVYQQTGIQTIQLNTLFQLYADLKYRPWILNNASTLLFTPDLLNFFLTGEKFNEYTISSTSQFFNPKKNEWVSVILEELGIPTRILQQIVYPGERIGKLLDDIKEECGIKEELTVIAVGSHDTASAVAATPFEKRENSVFLSSGTWSLLGMELDSPLINEKTLEENFTNELGVARKVRFLKNISGLWLIQECKRCWARDGLELSYAEISEAATKARPFIFRLNPDDPRFLNPTDMPATIKEYCKETGQEVPEDYGEMARGIYESLAFSYKDVIEKLENLTDRKIETINMVGGGIQAEILCQFTANITGKRVLTGPVEATAMGNIITQLMALGEIADLEEGRELVRRSIELKEFLPES
ncbi:MAG: rhamnulokinase [Halanaerobiales bacterium]|nr:rhamnulokinase [Halanaerobiales bacterium]